MMATALTMVYLALSRIYKGITRTDSKLREGMRVAQFKYAKLSEILAKTEDHLDKLRRYDPDLFLQNLATAKG